VNKYEEWITGIDHKLNLNQSSDKSPQISGNREINGHFYGKMNDVSVGKIGVRALLMDSVRKNFDMMPKKILFPGILWLQEMHKMECMKKL